MTVKELEHILEMPRANIRYYEQENLIRPQRRKNGYRDYSQEDVMQLKKIKLLRELGVSLGDIKKLQEQELSLQEVMHRTIAAMDQKKQEIARAEKICREIQMTEISYQQLDADRYLQDAFLSRETENGEQVPAVPEKFLEDVPEMVPPVRRFAARVFDTACIQGIFICAVSIYHRDYRDVWMMPGVMPALWLFWMFIEPLCIHFAGTTAGRWIFGLYLTDKNGKKPGYRAALQRTFQVYLFGMGLYLPILNLYCLYKSYVSVSQGWKAVWEKDTEYRHRESALDGRFLRMKDGTWRYALLAAACLAGVLVIHGFVLYGQIPKNRGRITLAEFAENYNQALRYFGYTDSVYQMKPDGTFYTYEEAQRLQDDAGRETGGVVLTLFEAYEIFQFSYSFDGEYLKQVSMQIDRRSSPKEYRFLYPRIQMAAAAHAFAGAQEGIGFWIQKLGKMTRRMLDLDTAECFSCEIGNMAVSCDVKCRGFGCFMDYMETEDGGNWFYLDFTAEAAHSGGKSK